MIDTVDRENVCHGKQPLAKSGPHFTLYLDLTIILRQCETLLLPILPGMSIKILFILPRG